MSSIFIRDFRRCVRALERQVELALHVQGSCCGVTPAQCHLLLAVEEANEPSVGEIAAELELDASTLSRTVNGLVKAGLLARREDPENRRRQLVSLTQEGKKRADAINQACDRYYEGLLAALPAPDSEAIARVLPTFVNAMRAWRHTCSAEDAL